MNYCSCFSPGKGSRSGLILFLFLLISACNPRIVSYNYLEEEINYKIKPLRNLGKVLKESSALEHFDNRFWSLNDGGNANAVYSFTQEKRSGIKEIGIHPSVNIDWESLSQDSGYFYIADIGDNLGRRDTLRIYLVSKENLLEGEGSVTDSISVMFSEKIPGSSGKDLSSFDCEAISVIGDSIYLFTKNWSDLTTSLYVIPRKPGTYRVSISSTLDVDFLVTGAGYCADSGDLWLIGYKRFHPVFMVIPDFISQKDRKLSYMRFEYPGHIGMQVEGIVCTGNMNIFFTCEKTFYPARLYKLSRKK